MNTIFRQRYPLCLAFQVIPVLIMFLLCFQMVKAADHENKVKLLVIIDATDPLLVDYKTAGNTVRQLILLGGLIDVAISEARQSSQSKRLRETVNEFDRFPVLKAGIEGAFVAQSQYFQLEVSDDVDLLRGKGKADLDAIKAKGFPFVLVLNEVFAGLVSAWKLSTLSAATTIVYELSDTNAKKSITQGTISAFSKAVHEFDKAVSDRPSFIQEYGAAAGNALGIIYGQLSKDGHLGTLAKAAGITDYVSTLEYFLNEYTRKFDYKIKTPKGWNVVDMGTKYTTVLAPKNNDRAKFGLRFDVDLLIKELGQELDDLDAYVALFRNKVLNMGYTID